MLTAEQMSRIMIIGPRSVIREVISELHSMKVLHIKEHVKTANMDMGSPLPENQVLSELLLSVSTVCNQLGLKFEPGEKFKKIETDEIKKRIDKISEEISTRLEQRKEISEKMISGLISRRKIEDSAHFIGFVSKDVGSAFKELKHKLLTIPYENNYLIYLNVGLEQSKTAERILKRFGFTDMEAHREITETEEEPMSMEELNSLRKKYNSVASLDETKEKNREFVRNSFHTLKTEIEKAESPMKFGSTERTFVINGWVPSRDEEKVRKRLLEVTSNKVYIECEKVPPSGDAPVRFSYPKFIGSFKFFLDLYSLPKYGEIDPTFILFFTFPILFGFMLGDIGYGLLPLALFLLLRSKIKSESVRALIDIFIMASIATTIFGVVFGEFFGAEIFKHPMFHRSSVAHIDSFITLAVFVGILHVTLGFIIGFFNVLKAHGLVHAVMEKFAWLLVMPSIIFILLAIDILKGGIGEFISALMPEPKVVFILFGIGMLMLLKGEGFFAVIELPGLLSNLLSYARLMAVGLASVLLAIVVNDMAGPMFASGLIGWIMGTFLLIVGHIVNILIGFLGCFLHALRLNYVEFFTKFYHGGGISYRPFGQLSKD